MVQLIRARARFRKPSNQLHSTNGTGGISSAPMLLLLIHLASLDIFLYLLIPVISRYLHTRQLRQTLLMHLSCKHLISMIYDEPAGGRFAPLDKIKTACEQDLNLFPVRRCTGRTTSRFTRHPRVLQFEVVHGAHMSQTVCCLPRCEPCCDKRRRGEASLLRMFPTFFQTCQ